MVSRTAVQTRKIKCLVVEVPVNQTGLSAEAPTNDTIPPAIENRRRPSARDLLPWADPYIAGLIRKLQDEVREERQLEHERTTLVAQEMGGNRPLAELLVDAFSDNTPLAHRPFEMDEPTERDWSNRPAQPR